MSDDFNLKPYEIDFVKLLVQYVVGIAVILILAGFIEPPENIPSYDPFHIFGITTRIYDSMILVATMAAEMITYLTIGVLTLKMAEYAFKVSKILLEKLMPYAIATLQLISDKKKQNEAESSRDTHEKRLTK